MKPVIISTKNNQDFEVQYRLGQGSFGIIFFAKDLKTNKEYALKIEEHSDKYPQLSKEYSIYRRLSGGHGIAKVHWFSREEDFNIMCMQLLGPSISHFFNYCNRRFSLKTVLMIADQLISRLEYMHNKNLIHRDLKPSNFLLGIEPNIINQIFLIDYGLCKEYMSADLHTHPKHKPQKSGLKFAGTARFASLNAHLGYTLSRRDDLESLGYNMIYLLKGKLPWQGCQSSPDSTKMEQILKKKASISLRDLCAGTPFFQWMKYVFQLQYESRPDYGYLRRILREIFFKNGYAADYRFDWVILNNTDKQSINILKYEIGKHNRYINRVEDKLSKLIWSFVRI